MANGESDRRTIINEIVGREIERVVEPYNHAFDAPAGLKRLDDLGLGKAIIHAPEDSKVFILGYILPLNREQTRHVLLFANGDLLIAEPKTPEDIEAYTALQSPSSIPYKFTTSDIFSAERSFISGTGKAKVVAQTGNTDFEILQTSLQEALELSKALKMEREATSIKSAEMMADVISAFFSEEDTQTEDMSSTE